MTNHYTQKCNGKISVTYIEWPTPLTSEWKLTIKIMFAVNSAT